MKIAILHTDLRIYWPDRLKALNSCLMENGNSLVVIEIAGKGSPYAFEKGMNSDNLLNWHILFPDEMIEEIPSSSIQKAIRKKLQELNPDILLAGALAFQSGAGALKWKSRTGKPIIIFDDARPEDVARNWIVNTVKKLLYQNVDAVICPAPSHASGLAKWGIKKKEIFFGIDVVNNSLFARNTDKIEKEIEKNKIAHPYLLAVGRQVEKKNWLGLLNAFIQFKRELPESLLNLVFIGEGPLHESLVECAEKHLGKDVFFLPFVQQKLLVEYYHQAKGLILPSRYGETWGLVVNEAMAAGLPVLVSKECGCVQTLVKEGINGWTFDPVNTKEMSEVIRKLDLLTHIGWHKMSQNSVEIIKDWGLTRFTEGVLHALEYVSTKPKIKSSLIGQLLANFWQGRYRTA